MNTLSRLKDEAQKGNVDVQFNDMGDGRIGYKYKLEKNQYYHYGSIIEDGRQLKDSKRFDDFIPESVEKQFKIDEETKASTSFSTDADIDDALVKGNKLHVERQFGLKDDSVVIIAKGDGKGNLSLNYPDYNGVRKDGNAEYGQYDIYTGFTNRTESGSSQELISHNIDWDKVNSVSGKTYDVKDFIKSKGLKWDRENTRWVKN